MISAWSYVERVYSVEWLYFWHQEQYWMNNIWISKNYLLEFYVHWFLFCFELNAVWDLAWYQLWLVKHDHKYLREKCSVLIWDEESFWKRRYIVLGHLRSISFNKAKGIDLYHCFWDLALSRFMKLKEIHEQSTLWSGKPTCLYYT